jgi:glyoxylase-like metal-dependent hydrolase (beta-lactamase superfamily II)
MAAGDETPFDTDPRVVHAAPETVAPAVRRVVARNPSPMTFTGTASYLVGETDIALIDPGPDDEAHAEALLAAVPPGGRITTILVTHAHRDHTGNVARLRAATGAPVLAFGKLGTGRSARMEALAARMAAGEGGEGGDSVFAPDACLADGACVAGAGWQLRAIHTPGHIGNHLCFALEGTGVLFSGDTVMGWSTTVVSPPEGDMGAFMASLDKLAARGDSRYLPGHGRPVEDPAAMIAWQIAHRKSRERSILGALQEGPATTAGLVARIYSGLNPALVPAARRNVLAHLLALEETGHVACGNPLDPAARFALLR